MPDDRVGYERQGSGYDPGARGYELVGRDTAPKLTLVMPFYRNPTMLACQFEGWAGWADKRKNRVEVILVDDGSPEPAADVPRPQGLPALRIYRVSEDRPWHQHAARNLGAHMADDGWLLLTDMDHVLPEESLRALLKRIDRGTLNESTIYMLDRLEADTGEPTTDGKGNRKPHPNSFLVTRELYWRIGGYDEDYTGIYGTDGLFKERAFRIGKRGYLPVPLIRYWRDLVPDASTDAPRKEGREPGARERVAAWKAEQGRGVQTLQFEWERVI